ncbi:PREDICTED: histone-lysine N-methyltransferase SETMAR-like [Polistes canadensis]|uniref:histone-lysine N-methyltransferase SETMAR-like n=1 Tax=Polistes canadensis TaxID=91411 RepID=UPI000718BE05|nr:PREDICTED: histone-lysine N-methyltransferase SETMAR-like [Polistes canadensis]
MCMVMKPLKKGNAKIGRPVKLNEDEIKTIIEADRHVTTREIAEKVNVSHTTIENHLKRVGLVKKLDIWVLHDLKEIHLTQLWWDWKGLVYFELLPRYQTINSEVYCRQLDKLNAAVKEKRPELVNRKSVTFQQDNARPHTSLATRKKLMDIGWELMLHPPYSPDLAPSDYHLFRSLNNSLRGKIFNDDDAVKRHLLQFLAEKDQTFYERGIFKLSERWQKVIEQNGLYIID